MERKYQKYLYFKEKYLSKNNCSINVASWLRNITDYSQAAHLQTLIALRDGALNDAKKLIRDNSYRSINSYFS